MGCGQSKIGIYQRKSKTKKNGGKRFAENGENEEETEEGEDTTNTEIHASNDNEKREESESVTSKIKQMAQQQTGGAVVAQNDISSSQLDFFKMLDEKIENGPDYEESDEEEHKTRLAKLLQEWKTACTARQQKKNEIEEGRKWLPPGRSGKGYQEDFDNYSARRINPVDTQRFPTGYSPCPPNNTLSMHLQNPFRMSAPAFGEQSRIQARIPVLGNYHPYQPPMETYNHCDTGHVLTTSESPNPLRTNYLLRQSSINSQLQLYSENQRLYPEPIRQFSDFPRPYMDQKPFSIPRTMPTVNVLHEQRIYAQDMSNRPYQLYQDDQRNSEEVQRMITDLPRQYADPQRTENIRPAFGNVENQRIYHERLLDKQRQLPDSTRAMEGPRAPNSFQRPPLLMQRMPEPPRIYREVENDESCFPRQERYSEQLQDSSTSRLYNPNAFKGGRSLSVEVQYVAGPPTPREMIPLQGAPGPPQGSPRPLIARGLQASVNRLPANSVVHLKKPQGAFT